MTRVVFLCVLYAAIGALDQLEVDSDGGSEVAHPLDTQCSALKRGLDVNASATLSDERRELYSSSKDSRMRELQKVKWPETCDLPVAVVEVFPYHDEVLPTSLKLVEAAGADCVAVLKADEGAREFDIFVEMRRWSPTFVLVHGKLHVFSFLETHDLNVVLINTFQIPPNPVVSRSLFRVLSIVHAKQKRPRLVAGCHNLSPFMKAYRNVTYTYPDFDVTPMTFHPHQSKSMMRYQHDYAHEHRLLEGEFIDWGLQHLPMTSIPFYFGFPHVEEGARHQRRTSAETVRILCIGELDSRRRHYRVMETLRDDPPLKPIEFIFFGREVESGFRSSLADLATSIPNVSASFYDGEYTILFKLVAQSDFVAPFLDNTTLGGAHNDYVDGKLSSSMAVATGFLVPIIGCATILENFELEGQIEVDETGIDFAQAINSAITVLFEDRSYYDAMRLRMCEFRHEKFSQARARMRQVFRETVSQLRHS